MSDRQKIRSTGNPNAIDEIERGVSAAPDTSAIISFW